MRSHYDPIHDIGNDSTNDNNTNISNGNSNGNGSGNEQQATLTPHVGSPHSSSNGSNGSSVGTHIAPHQQHHQTRVNISSLLSDSNASDSNNNGNGSANGNGEPTPKSKTEPAGDTSATPATATPTGKSSSPDHSNSNSNGNGDTKRRSLSKKNSSVEPLPGSLPPSGTFTTTDSKPKTFKSSEQKPKQRKSSNISSSKNHATGGRFHKLDFNNNSHVVSPASLVAQQLHQHLNEKATSKLKRTNQTLIISAKQHHIKKKDGEPLWRRDIQYEFLKEVFLNDQKVFTNPYSKETAASDNDSDNESEGGSGRANINGKLSFSDLYIATMAHSPKTSKVLRDRLLTDKAMAVPVAMVSLLVNVGRMNTTINFVPEMKSQLRTYHSIPSLQHDKAQNNKILQDSPRLKSILKSCCEYKGEPTNFQELFETTKSPRTNVINIIFLLCSFEHLLLQHFDESNIEKDLSRTFITETPIKDLNLDNIDLTNPLDSPFNCIFLNFKTTPRSRAKRFLWLLYNYLETSLTKEEILQNPFKDNDHPLLIPFLEDVPEGEEFDIDPPAEQEYAQLMLDQRRNFLRADWNSEPGDTPPPASSSTTASSADHANGSGAGGSGGNAAKGNGHGSRGTRGGRAAGNANNHGSTRIIPNIAPKGGVAGAGAGASGSSGDLTTNAVNNTSGDGEGDITNVKDKDGKELNNGTTAELAAIRRSGRGTKSTNRVLKLSRADKRKIENGSSKIKEFKPEEIYYTIYAQNKQRHRKKRRTTGNVLLVNHLLKSGELIMEEEIVTPEVDHAAIDQTADSQSAAGTGSSGGAEIVENETMTGKSNGTKRQQQQHVAAIANATAGVVTAADNAGKGYNDFGEFASSCVKAYRASRANYERLYILKTDLQADIERGQEGKANGNTGDVDVGADAAGEVSVSGSVCPVKVEFATDGLKLTRFSIDV